VLDYPDTNTVSQTTSRQRHVKAKGQLHLTQVHWTEEKLYVGSAELVVILEEAKNILLVYFESSPGY